jgi:hypothetical protein
MQASTEENNRLLNFCSKLPGIPGPAIAAQAEAKFVIDMFARRREEVAKELNAPTGNAMVLSLLRSEAGALDCATQVVREVWRRRFGMPLA